MGSIPVRVTKKREEHIVLFSFFADALRARTHREAVGLRRCEPSRDSRFFLETTRKHVRRGDFTQALTMKKAYVIMKSGKICRLIKQSTDNVFCSTQKIVKEKSFMLDAFDVQKKIDSYGISIYQGTEVYQKEWKQLLAKGNPGEIITMIHKLCDGKANNQNYVIFISKYEDGMHNYKAGYRKFTVTFGKNKYQTYYAKRVLKSRIDEMLQTEAAAKSNYLYGLQMDRQFSAAAEKINKGHSYDRISSDSSTAGSKIGKYVRICCFGLIALFSILSLVFAIGIFNGASFAQEINSLAADYYCLENVSTNNLSSTSLLFFTLSCTIIGYLSLCYRAAPESIRDFLDEFDHPDLIWCIGSIVVYVLSMTAVIFFHTRYQIQVFCNGDIEAFFHTTHSWYFMFSLEWGILSIVWFALSFKAKMPRIIVLLGCALLLAVMPHILIAAATAIALIFLIFIMKILHKIKVFLQRYVFVNSSSSSRPITYSYLNSMSCRETVTSDDGVNFYDETGRKVGVSDDKGTTLNLIGNFGDFTDTVNLREEKTDD